MLITKIFGVTNFGLKVKKIDQSEISLSFQ